MYFDFDKINILNEFIDAQVAKKEQNTKFDKTWFFAFILL